MTAPLVVANWINMQYYASTVDPIHFGSGNKTVHNVVGRFGVFSGNGGDLTTGLPWQSVHDGKGYQHHALRLLAIIAAPRQAIEAVIAKHDVVANLVTNAWIQLVAVEEGTFYRYTEHQTWDELTCGSQAVRRPLIRRGEARKRCGGDEEILCSVVNLLWALFFPSTTTMQSSAPLRPGSACSRCVFADFHRV